jgi:hypothetical protein
MATAARAYQSISPLELSILAFPILVLTATEMVLGFGGDTGVSIPVLLVADPLLPELTARYHAYAAFVFFVTVSLAVTAIFFCDLVRRFTWGSRLKVVFALVAVILVTLVFSVLEPEAIKGFETYELLGEDLFRATLGAARTGACLPDRATCAWGTAFDMMNLFVDVSNRIVSLAAAAALTGLILALARYPQEPATPDECRAHIRDARRTAQRYLYCAGLLLTAGMIWVEAWMTWPAPLIAAEDERAAFLGMVNAFALFRGTTFSLLILSVYLPVHLLLAGRIECLREEHGEPGLAAQDGADNFSYTEALKTVTAIVSPILMGVVGSAWNVTLGL